MWKQDWTIPPQDPDEMLAWQVYTRVWKDVGLRPPGQWLVMWMKSTDIHPASITHEAVVWYIHECKE